MAGFCFEFMSWISFLPENTFQYFYILEKTCLLLTVATLAYCAAYDHSASHTVFVVLSVLFFHFLFSGVLLATACWFLTNSYLREESPNSHVVEQRVEWLYAFDVHCNSFFPMFVMLYVIHYFLSPLLVAHGFIPVLLSNLIFMVAASYYHYLNFLGYDGKPNVSDCSATFPREDDLFPVSNRHRHCPLSHLYIKWLQPFKILHEHVLQSKADITSPHQNCFQAVRVQPFRCVRVRNSFMCTFEIDFSSSRWSLYDS
ncbi:Protein unc-50 homolog [Linum perenne]